MRTLDADGMSPALLGVVLVAGLAGVWSSWLIAARVPVYQLSEAARLEVERIHPVSSPVVGRVVSTSLVLGRDVLQGDVLLEVEAERERLETAEERTRLASVGGEISELQRQRRGVRPRRR
jgi:multidrug resistance efflux pump